MDYIKAVNDIEAYFSTGKEIEEKWFQYVKLVKLSFLIGEIRKQLPEDKGNKFLENLTKIRKSGAKEASSFKEVFEYISKESKNYNLDLDNNWLENTFKSIAIEDTNEEYLVKIKELEDELSRLSGEVAHSKKLAADAENKLKEIEIENKTKVELSLEISKLQKRIAQLEK